MLGQTIGLLKPNPYGAKAYAELLQVLYEIFQKARKDGLVGLESHIENPEGSDIFRSTRRSCIITMRWRCCAIP